MTPAASPTDPTGVRLQKALAGAGIASRRVGDALVAAGRVTVNGVVARPGTRIDPDRDVVAIDGDRVVLGGDRAYLLLHKPLGVLSAMSDPQGRSTVADLVPAELSVHHVGRLDADSEGLLIMTNDGELGHRLTHPSYRVPKRYLADVTGKVTPADLRALRRGVALDDGAASADDAQLVQSVPGHSLVEVTVHEGRNRLVRRMFDAVGHPVERLVRVSIGPLRLGELRAGRWRHLQRAEIESLMRLVDM
jgi:23S rRNA pseudouridine2605 synthase